jgi:Ribbon-helix-helix protein, copG family
MSVISSASKSVSSGRTSNSSGKVTHMVKTQVYLRKEELDALRMAAARSGRSIAELIRDAIRKIVLKAQAAGPVAIWDGEPRRASIEHDRVHDER